MTNRLQKRLLVITLIPALIFFCGFMVLANSLYTRAITQLFADAVGQLTQTITPVLARPDALADPLSTQVLDGLRSSSHAHRVHIIDATGSTLMTRGRSPLGESPGLHADTPRQQRTDDWLRVSVPLQMPDRSDSAKRWLEVDYSLAPIRLAQYRLAALILLLGGVGTIGLVLVVLRGAQSTWKPFVTLEQTVQRLARGEFTARMPDNEPVLLSLGTRINELGDSLQGAHQEMQDNVNQATQDLRETLETLEIQNIELLNARRQAVEASEIKSQFLANMSHEIRTPLHGLLGFVNLVEKTQLDHQQLDYIRTIRQSGESLLAIINNILDVMKLDAGKLELEHRSINLRDLVEDVLDMLAPMAREKPVELVSMVYDDIPSHVMGDPLRLRQILVNLASNAVKFTESGHVMVRIAQEGSDREHIRLRITVSDTGPGIARDQQKRLFRAFNQADVSTSRKFGGTGLGLMICQRLVQRMGGRIELESNQNQGTTFAVLLDLAYDPNNTDQTDERLLAGSRVLLHEPNELSRLSLRHHLMRWGAEFEEISSDLAASATGQLPTTPFHLAILTFDRHRLAWLKQVCEACQARGVPVIMGIRHGEPRAEMEQIEPLIQGVFTKPVRRRKLARLCTRNLRATPEAEPELPSAEVRLLIVDDNATNRYLIRALLDEMNILHHEANNGVEALSQISRNHYDLILMDLRMPGMDGLTATQEIRRYQAEGAHTPIYALTAHAPDDAPDYWEKNGFDGYLPKPINESHLVQILQQHTGLPLDPGAGPAARARVNSARDESGQTDNGRATLISPGLALQRASQRPDLARDMFAGLLQQLGPALDTWPDLLARQDLDALLDDVHALHGVILYCGTPELEDSVRQLEQLLRQPAVDPGRLTDALQQSLVAARRLLDLPPDPLGETLQASV